jgi:ABC-2 type transport system ATP-binding protein
VLEDASFHPGRTGRDHLRVLAVAGEHPPGRVGDVLRAVELDHAADRRVKGYSMGMRQRLAIAGALLGDPEVLILDEPTNGLDPPGIRWVRDLVRAQAASGRTVLVSSHLLAEVAQSVDDVVVIAKGELRAQGPLEQVLGSGGELSTEVRSPDAARLGAALRDAGHHVQPTQRPDTLVIPGSGPEDVGRIAAAEGVVLYGLAPRSRSLESAFFELTGSGR